MKILSMKFVASLFAISFLCSSVSIHAQDLDWIYPVGGPSGAVSVSEVLTEPLTKSTIVAGSFSGSVDLGIGSVQNTVSSAGRNLFVVKLDSIGSQEWLWYSTGASGCDLKDLTFASNGDLLLTGTFNDSLHAGVINLHSYNKSVFAIRINASTGYGLWGQTVQGGSSYGSSIIELPNGNLCITGESKWQTDFDPGSGISQSSSTQISAYLWLLDGSNGQFEGIVDIQCDNGASRGHDLLLHPNGNITLTGYLLGTLDIDTSSTDMVIQTVASSYNPGECFIAQFDSQFNPLWYEIVPGEAGKSVVTSSGDIFITGLLSYPSRFTSNGVDSILSPSSPRDIFLAKYAGNGGLIWVDNVISGTALVQGIATDKDDNVLLGGNFGLDATFGRGSNSMFIPYTNNGPGYAARFDQNGQIESVLTFGSGDVFVNGMSSLDTNDVTLVGRFNGIVDFNPNPDSAYSINSLGAQMGFIVHLEDSSSVSVGIEQFYPFTGVVYPNPTTERVTIDLGDQMEIDKVEVVNSVGQVLLSKAVFSSQFEVEMPAKPDIYTVFVYSLNGRVYPIKIIKQ